jgi:hypothetical protein
MTTSDMTGAPQRTTTTRKQRALRWLPSFVGFPIGGVIAELIVGPIDAVGAALIGGAISGVILGAAQAWGLGWTDAAARRWTLATGLGFAGGIAIGAAAVDYGTSMGDFALQGALCGLLVGAAQAVVLRSQLGRAAALWAPALSALWALGWVISTAIGVDVDRQWTVFGASGAITVTLATAVLPVLLAERGNRGTS